MKEVTPRQIRKVLDVIIESGTDGDQLQDVLASGLLTDVLTGQTKEIDFSKRNMIRVLLEHKSWGEIWIEIRRPGYKFGEYESGSRCPHCDLELPTMEIHGTTSDGKKEFIRPVCSKRPCIEWVKTDIKQLIKERSPKNPTKENTVHLLTLGIGIYSGVHTARRVLVEKNEEDIIYPSGKKVSLDVVDHNDLSRPLTPKEVLYFMRFGCCEYDDGISMPYSPDYK